MKTHNIIKQTRILINVFTFSLLTFVVNTKGQNPIFISTLYCVFTFCLVACSSVDCIWVVDSHPQTSQLTRSRQYNLLAVQGAGEVPTKAL